MGAGWQQQYPVQGSKQASLGRKSRADLARGGAVDPLLAHDLPAAPACQASGRVGAVAGAGGH